MTGAVIDIVATGVIATLVMDVVSLALKRIGLFDGPDYRFVGRWLGHTFVSRSIAHKSIAHASPLPFEREIGWAAHYATGIAFTGLLIAIVGMQWLQTPTLAPALLTGLATLVFPLFVMQPAFGLGLAARLSPNPRKALLRSLTNHLLFGLGLYLAGVVSAAI